MPQGELAYLGPIFKLIPGELWILGEQPALRKRGKGAARQMEDGGLVNTAGALPDVAVLLEPLDALLCRLGASVEKEMRDMGERHETRFEERLQDGEIPLLQFNLRACRPCS
jgi:hypothetical protein